jgi:hypothetical protein
LHTSLAVASSSASNKQPKQFSLGTEAEEDEKMLCRTVVTRDRRYITQITCFEKGNESQDKSPRPSSYGKQTSGGALASLFNFPSRLTRTRNQLQQQQLLTGTSHLET